MDEFKVHLESLGFTEDQVSLDAAKANAEAQGMSHNGPYAPLLAMVNGDVLVVVEQNTAREDMNGMTALVEHPPVVVINGPKGRVAANPADLELVSALIAELS